MPKSFLPWEATNKNPTAEVQKRKAGNAPAAILPQANSVLSAVLRSRRRRQAGNVRAARLTRESSVLNAESPNLPELCYTNATSAAGNRKIRLILLNSVRSAATLLTAMTQNKMYFYATLQGVRLNLTPCLLFVL